jgi:hypothetical protein
MSSLVLCSGCGRHVKADDTACPFCQATRASHPIDKACQGPCAGHRSPRLGRAALMTAGAALLCAACWRSTFSAYGTSPPFDAGAQAVDAGGQKADSGDAQTDAARDALPDAQK